MSDQLYAQTSSKHDEIQTPQVNESQQSFITQDQTENKTPCPWVIESQQSLNTQDMNKIPSNSVAIDNVNVTAKLPPYNIASPSSPVPRNYFLKPANEEMSRKKMIPSELRQHLARNIIFQNLSMRKRQE